MMYGDDFEKDLDSIGEDEVRKRLSRSLYTLHHRDIVVEWLRKKDAEHHSADRSFDRRMQWSILIVSCIAAIAAIASLITK